MKINEVFDVDIKLEVDNLMADSRVVSKNAMFFCIEGMSFDGHHFIKQAIDNGAICVVHSKNVHKRDDRVVYIKVKDVLSALNKAVAVFYNYQSDKFKVIGVTGTYGKTTVAFWLQQLLNIKENCGYIGSKGVKYLDYFNRGNFTNPEAIPLGENLAKMQESGVTTCAMEVSSITNELRNNEFINYQMGIFTNISSEHLDFHGTFNNYLLAKKSFFDNLKPGSIAVVNVDDENSQKMIEDCQANIITYGVYQTCSYQGVDIELFKDGSSFTLLYQGERYDVVTNVIGEFNVSNLLGVIAAAHQLGVSLPEIIKKVTNMSSVAGRMERIIEGQCFEVIVDFAHTPKGIKEVFEYAKRVNNKDGRIIAVFGAPGKRDITNREILGSIADEFCDLIILTEEDPRNESAYDIADQIAKGIKNTEFYFVEDREIAINQAIETAQRDDIVLILAKGDELFIDRGLGKTMYNYKGDAQIARESLRLLCN